MSGCVKSEGSGRGLILVYFFLGVLMIGSVMIIFNEKSTIAQVIVAFVLLVLISAVLIAASWDVRG